MLCEQYLYVWTSWAGLHGYEKFSTKSHFCIRILNFIHYQYVVSNVAIQRNVGKCYRQIVGAILQTHSYLTLLCIATVFSVCPLLPWHIAEQQEMAQRFSTCGSQTKRQSRRYFECISILWWFLYTYVYLQIIKLLNCHIRHTDLCFYFTFIFICDSWGRKHGHFPSLVRRSNTCRKTVSNFFFILNALYY